MLIYCKIASNINIAAFVFGLSLNYAEMYAPTIDKKLLNVLAAFLFIAGLVLGSYPVGSLDYLPASFVLKDTIFEHLPAAVLKQAEWFHVLGAYFLVISFVISAPMQRIVSTRVFRFLAYISFTLYLLHLLIIGSFSCYLFLNWHERFGYNHAVAYIFVLTVALTLSLAWLMAKYIDDPGIKFSKYVYDRWFKEIVVDATDK
jgi:peptidoglycan/LPS O-acetylase OafA/YrhL